MFYGILGFRGLGFKAVWAFSLQSLELEGVLLYKARVLGVGGSVYAAKV